MATCYGSMHDKQKAPEFDYAKQDSSDQKNMSNKIDEIGGLSAIDGEIHRRVLRINLLRVPRTRRKVATKMRRSMLLQHQV